MQLGMIGLGRMGGNMVSRLIKHEHELVVFDVNPETVKSFAGEGATGRGEHRCSHVNNLPSVDGQTHRRCLDSPSSRWFRARQRRAPMNMPLSAS